MRADPAPSPVLYVSHESGCGGAELSLLTLLAGIDRARFPPRLVTSADGELAARARALGVPCEFVAGLAGRGLARALRLLPSARAVGRLAAAHGARLLHANTLMGGYVALRAARAGRLATLWHVRDIGYPWLARRAAARATAIVANSAATAKALALPARSAARVRVVFNGVGPEFFAARASGALHREIGAAPGDLLVGLVARCDPWKGHEDLLLAAPSVLAAVPAARFVIVGGQPLAGGRAPAGFALALRELARRLGIAERVHFLGQRDDVAALLPDLDVVAHPVREPEPFGRAVAEAFAAGRAVVASGLGGLVELVEDRGTGLLVRPRDPEALAGAIAILLLDPALRGRLGEKARAFAGEELTRSAHVRRMCAVYDEVLGGRE
jgi:glycosyltransferase involved in cell wall biosynthesis